MKHFSKTCAQGEIGFIKLGDDYSIPKNAIKVIPESDGKIIIGHSETGHHHVMSAESSTIYRLPNSILECLLVVNKPDILEHLREFDTHEPILFTPGTYKVKYLREYDPNALQKERKILD